MSVTLIWHDLAEASIRATPPNTDPDAWLDITADICPMTYVRTRLALDRLTPGQTLAVRLRGADPLRNVPANAIAQGHAVLRITPGEDGATIVFLRRSG